MMASLDNRSSLLHSIADCPQELFGWQLGIDVITLPALLRSHRLALARVMAAADPAYRRVA